MHLYARLYNWILGEQFTAVVWRFFSSVNFVGSRDLNPTGRSAYFRVQQWAQWQMTRMNHCSKTCECCKQQGGEAAGRGDLLRHSVFQLLSLQWQAHCKKLTALSAPHQQKWVLGLGRQALEGLKPVHMFLFILRAGKRAAFMSLTIPGICSTPQTAGLRIRINDDNCISRTRGTISVWNKSSSECWDIFSFTVPEMSVN